MEQQKFDKSTAAALVAMLMFPESVEVKDDGVFVSEGFRACSPDGKAFKWTPSCAMRWPGAPNPIASPALALPIPFTAGELAAFMIDGAGAGIQHHLNRRIGYPLDDEALEHFDEYFWVVCEALRSAYAVAEKAQSVVGEYDYEEAKRAYNLREQLDNAEGQANQIEGVFEPGISNDEASQRRERAVASNAELKARVTKVNAEVDAKWAKWRTAMVRQILFTEPQAATAPSAAPVRAGSADGVTEKEPRALATGPVYSMTRSAMIKAHESEWTSIIRDIKDASENGLSVAKAGARDWNEAAALEWARSKGKLNSAPKPADALTQGINSMASLTRTRHKLKG